MYKPTISKPMFSYCCINTYYPQTAKITLAIFSIPVRVQQRFFNLLQSDSVTIFCTSYQKKKKSSFSKWTISIDISSFLRPPSINSSISSYLFSVPTVYRNLSFLRSLVIPAYHWKCSVEKPIEGRFHSNLLHSVCRNHQLKIFLSFLSWIIVIAWHHQSRCFLPLLMTWRPITWLP